MKGREGRKADEVRGVEGGLVAPADGARFQGIEQVQL